VAHFAQTVAPLKTGAPTSHLSMITHQTENIDLS